MTTQTRTVSAVMFLIAVAAAFSALPQARAGTAHQLFGEVGSPSASTTYESYGGTASLFLMNDGLAEIVTATYTPNNLTDAANYIDDAGSLWTWAAGNTALAVIETVRGVNGWASSNWTTSSTVIMTDTAGFDEFPNNPLEAMPMVTTTAGADYVQLGWTGLMDVAGAVLNYEVFETGASVGASTPQIAGGAVSFNHTTLTPGSYCYSIGVNYQRTLVGATWTGTARSESVCDTVSAGPVPPEITATIPADGAVGVALTANVVVTFSEPMNTGSVAWTPASLSGSWTGSVLTLTHAVAFTENTVVTVNITAGMDTTGVALVPGAAPNPWSFTTVGVAPQVVSTVPANGAPNVPVASTITVTFSEAMDATGSVTTVALTPDPGGVPSGVWTVGDTVLTWTPGALLTECVVYSASVTGTDVPGNALVVVTWSFTTFCSSPYITLVDPVDGTLNVATTTVIVVWFSEPMNVTASCTFTPVPTFAFGTPAWDGTNESATLTPTASLTPGTGYNITVDCRDVDDNVLVIGPVPNPFDFVTATGNSPPSVAITAPTAGLSWTGGLAQTITWTVTDDAPVAETNVWLNYTDGTNTGTVAGPLAGDTTSYLWTAPCLDTTTMTITAEAYDLASASDTAVSALFTLDCAPPTVTSRLPSTATITNLAIDVVVTFSEPMNQAATAAAFSIAPVVAHGTVAWSGNAMTVPFATPNLLSPNVTYTVTIAITATDASSPGLGLASPYTFTFRPLPVPNAPVLAAPTAGQTTVTLTWTAPTTYVPGPVIPGSVTLSYAVYRSTTLAGTGTLVDTVTALTYTDDGLTADTPYWYHVYAIADGEQSASSTVETITTQRVGGDDGFDWTLIIVAIIAIVAVVGLLLFLMMRKKKQEPEGETPAPPEGEEAPPTEEKPEEPAAEGETPPEPPSESASPEELPAPSDEKGTA